MTPLCTYCAELMLWKSDEEKKSTTKFVKRNGGHKTATGFSSLYHCNRSGNHASHSTGKCQLKSQGSSRSGECCPASMTITEEDGSLKVLSTHHGHEGMLCHLTLTTSERQEIGGKHHDNKH